MTKYAAEHSGAYADIQATGAEVSFRKKTTIVSGVALQIRGDPEEYEALKLIEKATLTLLFVAETYGDSPPLGASCEWGELRYQVEAIRKLAPDGTAVLSRVIVSR